MVINDIKLAQSESANQALQDVVRGFFWSWFEQHSDDMLLEKRVVFFTIKIRVYDIRHLFEKLFGFKPLSVN